MSFDIAASSMHLQAITTFCCCKADDHKLNDYMQGYEITMADLVPEEDKVSCRRPENVSLDSTCGSTDAIVIFRRRSSVAFVTNFVCCSRNSLWSSTRLSTMSTKSRWQCMTCMQIECTALNCNCSRLSAAPFLLNLTSFAFADTVCN